MKNYFIKYFKRSLLYLFLCMKINYAYLNLYLNSSEVQRLLGIEAELYYVRAGNINENALNHIISIPTKLDLLYFTWESLTGYPLPYSIMIETNSTSFLLPKLNITSTGTIPINPEIFSINIPCPINTAENLYYILITVNITITNKNITKLNFYRSKICNNKLIESEKNEMIAEDLILNENYNNFLLAPTIYVFLAVVFISLLLITYFGTIFCMYYEQNKTNDPNINRTRTSTFLTTVPRSTVNTSYASFRRMPSYSLISERSKDLQERIAELTVQRSHIRLISVILEGTFGRVYKGTYTTDNGNEETVIIKTVTDHASQVQISLLLQEGMSMYSLNHKNILSILRVSIEDRTAPFLLYPFNGNTNLKIFLQKCKLSSEGISHTLTTQEVVDMSLQIIHALQYLHKKRLLHKDLAARNCVVDDKLRIQVADNALSRDLFPADYHCLGDNENRPVKWLAIESLVQKTFSVSSDVWSFGVLLWELTTLAQQPYIEIDPFEMAAYLKDGYRLAQPINCPDELFAVMAYCWAMSVDERPTVTQLQVCLQDFYAQLIRYV